MADTSQRRAASAAVGGLLLFVIAGVVLVMILRQNAVAPDPVRRVAPIEDPSFSLAVIGDFGTGSESEDAVAAELHRWVRRSGADALVTTGDNVYPAGAPQYFESAWGEPYGWVEERGVEVLASLGNHDFEYQGGAAIVDHFDMPGLWYREVVGDTEIFVLDANRVDNDAQTRWLDRALSDSTAAWKIVVFHQPAYSCSEHGSTPEIVERWVPLFEREDVDLVFNGHDHNYQRFSADDAPTYVVTGGGGANLYPLEDCEFDSPDQVVADDETHHFLYVEGDRRRVRVRAVSREGDVLDDFELGA